MTFRTRLVLAAAVAVVVAIILAAFAAYFVAERSLVSSLDDTLSQQVAAAIRAQNVQQVGISGDIYQLVTAQGTPVAQPEGQQAMLPITPDVEAVAAGTKGTFYSTVQVNGEDWRQIVTPGTDVLLQVPVAIQVAAPLSGVNHQLAHLRVILGIVAA